MKKLIAERKIKEYYLRYYLIKESKEYGIEIEDPCLSSKCIIKGIRKSYAEELVLLFVKNTVCPEHLLDILRDITLI